MFRFLHPFLQAGHLSIAEDAAKAQHQVAQRGKAGLATVSSLHQTGGRTSNRLSHVGRLLLDQFEEPPSLVPLQAYDYLSNGPFRTIKTFMHAVKHNMLQRSSEVNVPCLILRGEKDPIVSQRWVEALGRAMPSAEVAVIPNAGHALNYNSAPAIAPRIVEFWRRGNVKI